MEKILIVRLGAMGDVIHGLPLAAALRQEDPNISVDWVIEERWRELLCATSSTLSGDINPQKPMVNDIHLVNTKRWRKNLLARSTRDELFLLRRELRSRSYDRVIDVQGAIRSAVIAKLTGCSRTTGFEVPRESPARFFYQQRVKAQGQHVIEQNLSLIGLEPPDRESGLLPVDRIAEAWSEEQLRAWEIKRFAILNPGAGWASKEWPAENYGALAKMLIHEGLTCIVNAGPGEEQIAKKVEECSGGSAKVISCSIGQLISLLRRAKLFIGGDTGPMHVANVLGVPVVAIFGPTNPARNGPFYQPSTVLRHESSATDYSHASRHHEGIKNITVGEVLDASRKILRS